MNEDVEMHDCESCELCRTGNYQAALLPDEVISALEAEAALWGRTVEGQLTYMMQCLYGSRPPAMGDETMRAQIKAVRGEDVPTQEKLEVFRDLMEGYFYHYFREKPSYPWSLRMYRRFFANDDWGTRPLAEITRPLLRTLHKQLAATPTQANQVVKLVKQAFSWAQNAENDEGELYWSGVNPACGIQKYRTYSRIRVLSDQELSVLLESMAWANWKLLAFLTVLLCTGCRMTEARVMRWEHIDLAQGRWLKPRTKNGLAQYMPLARQAVEALKALPHENSFVFAGMKGKEWSRPAAEKAWSYHRASIGLQDVWLHDLRRTVATRLYEAERDAGCEGVPQPLRRSRAGSVCASKL